MSEVFESSTFSTLLSWFCNLPELMCVVIAPFAVLGEILGHFKKSPGKALFVLWISLSIFLFSPLRLIAWQLVFATSTMVQSWGGLVRILFLSFIGIFVFPIIYTIAVLIICKPVVFCDKWLKGEGPVPSGSKIFGYALLTPVLALVSSLFLVITSSLCAQHLMHVTVEDAIRGSNEPTYFINNILIHPFSSDKGNRFTTRSMPDGLGKHVQTEKEMYRLRTAMIYLNEDQFHEYVEKAYPAYIKERFGK